MRKLIAALVPAGLILSVATVTLFVIVPTRAAPTVIDCGATTAMQTCADWVVVG